MWTTVVWRLATAECWLRWLEDPGFPEEHARAEGPARAVRDAYLALLSVLPIAPAPDLLTFRSLQRPQRNREASGMESTEVRDAGRSRDYGDLQELTANNAIPAFVDVPQGTPITDGPIVGDDRVPGDELTRRRQR